MQREGKLAILTLSNIRSSPQSASINSNETTRKFYTAALISLLQIFVSNILTWEVLNYYQKDAKNLTQLLYNITIIRKYSWSNYEDEADGLLVLIFGLFLIWEKKVL